MKSLTKKAFVMILFECIALSPDQNITPKSSVGILCPIIASKRRHNWGRRQTMAPIILKSELHLVKWRYSQQDKWFARYPDCAGSHQSPVNIPEEGYAKKHKIRMKYIHHDVVPKSMKLRSDGQRLILTGNWGSQKPKIQCGRAYLMYWFHSIVLHWPSEHTVGGKKFPLESQVLYISSNYRKYKEAVWAASNDPQSMLGIASFYQVTYNASETQPGLNTILRAATIGQFHKKALLKSLNYFSPPLADYASYQGSLTAPPCVEGVLWLVRSELLPITDDNIELAESIVSSSGEPINGRSRALQELHDREVYKFESAYF